MTLVLEAPQKPENSNDGYLYQICISWNVTQHLFGADTAGNEASNQDRVEIIRHIAQDWAEPFRSFVNLITDTTSVKQLDVDDFAPHAGLHSIGKMVLVGDSFHAMTMCKFIFILHAQD
jgi:hypothetical protein